MPSRPPRLPALQYAQSGVTQGLSANQAYRNYQELAHEAGLTALRRQDFLQLYSQTRALRETAVTALGWPKDVPPDPAKIGGRRTQGTTGYGQYVLIHQRSRDAHEYFQMPYLVRSERPLTPAEAEAEAESYLNNQTDRYNRTTIGVGYVGTVEFQPDPY